MGISKHLINDYKMVNENCKYLETPFGNVIVKDGDKTIPFKLSNKSYNINCEKKLNTNVFKIEIETNNLKCGDIIDVCINKKSNLQYYDSDENTIMISETKNDLVFAIIGYDTDYDYTNMEFYNEDYYGYALKETYCQGLKYEILNNPKKCETMELSHIISLWITWVPINREHDIEEEIFLKLA